MPASAQKADYLKYIQEPAEQGWEAYPEVVERWRANVDPSMLWGYNSTAQPIYLADILGPTDRRLLIQFLDRAARTDGTYRQERHGQQEIALYQTQSSHYRPGDVEVFVTALIPHDADADPDALARKVALLPPDPRRQGVGIRIAHADGRVSTLGVKVDLDAEVVTANIRPRYTWEAGRTQYGPFETDAHFFFATQTADEVVYAASEFLNVYVCSLVLLIIVIAVWTYFTG